MRKYLSHKEAAQYLGVSESALYTWKCQGDITAKKHGKLNFYDLEVLDSFGVAEEFGVTPYNPSYRAKENKVVLSEQLLKGARSLTNKKIKRGHSRREY